MPHHREVTIHSGPADRHTVCEQMAQTNVVINAGCLSFMFDNSDGANGRETRAGRSAARVVADPRAR